MKLKVCAMQSINDGAYCNCGVLRRVNRFLMLSSEIKSYNSLEICEIQRLNDKCIICRNECHNKQTKQYSWQQNFFFSAKPIEIEIIILSQPLIWLVGCLLVEPFSKQHLLRVIVGQMCMEKKKGIKIRAKKIQNEQVKFRQLHTNRVQ